MWNLGSGLWLTNANPNHRLGLVLVGLRLVGVLQWGAGFLVFRNGYLVGPSPFLRPSCHRSFSLWFRRPFPPISAPPSHHFGAPCHHHLGAPFHPFQRSLNSQQEGVGANKKSYIAGAPSTHVRRPLKPVWRPLFLAILAFLLAIFLVRAYFT